jgi:hypothetical protein
MDLSRATWRKSSHSGGNGGQCVEVASDLPWRKSSYSSGTGGTCVEVATGLPGVVAVQDSKNPGPALVLPVAAFEALTAAVRAGRLGI